MSTRGTAPCLSVSGETPRSSVGYLRLLPSPEELAVLERSPMGFYQSTPDGRFLYVNAAMAGFLGYRSPKELLGAVNDIATQLYFDPAARARLMERLDREERVRDFHVDLRRLDGSCARLFFDASVVRDADGKPLLYEGFVRAGGTPNDLLELLVPAAREIGDALRGLTSFLRLLAAREKRSAEFAHYALQSVSRAQGLVDNLRWLVQMEELPLRWEPVELAGVVEVAGWMLRAELEACGAVLVRETLPTVLGDKAHLVRAFRNLIENSLRFRGNEPPRIVVRGTRGAREHLVSVSVSDNGIGFPSEAFGDRFPPCRRYHDGAHTGAGMGLYVTSRIIARHRGRLSIVRRPAPGAELLLVFPPLPDEAASRPW